MSLERSESNVSSISPNKELLALASLTPFSSDLVVEALQAATMAPNHRRTEPWRFISLGQNSIDKVSALNPPKQSRWSSIKGWMVFTSPLSHSDPLLEKEDYAAVCCAIQNFSLALWAHGVGTKWTTGGEAERQYEQHTIPQLFKRNFFRIFLAYTTYLHN